MLKQEQVRTAELFVTMKPNVIVSALASRLQLANYRFIKMVLIIKLASIDFRTTCKVLAAFSSSYSKALIKPLFVIIRSTGQVAWKVKKATRLVATKRSAI